jgi:hypothetical protein
MLRSNYVIPVSSMTLVRSSELLALTYHKARRKDRNYQTQNR